MSVYQVVPTDMSRGSAFASDAASDARGADGSAALSSLGSALPGSSSAEFYPGLGSVWSTGVSEWADSAETLADQIEAASKDASATDSGAAGIFGGLFGSGG